jgi:hypothetical protein
MVYKQDGYTLYKRKINFKGLKDKHTIYFFAKKVPKVGTPCDIPEGKEIGKNQKTGLLYLQNKK